MRARRYPKPPVLPLRLVLLCLRPETWAEVARYPTWVVMVPLVLTVILGTAAAATGQTKRAVDQLREFAASYDSHYPPLELSSDGTLSVKGDLSAPIRVPLLGGVVLVDPTGKTRVETIRSESVRVLVTDKELVSVADEGRTRWTLKSFLTPLLGPGGLPPAGQTRTLDGKTMAQLIDDKVGIAAAMGVGAFIIEAAGEALWVAMMMILACPIIMLAAAGPRLNPDAPDRRLLLPRRAAYRMAAGLLVPLVMLSAILRAIGHPIYESLGLQGAWFFWFFAAGALAVWTGLMAKRMYGRREKQG